MTAEAASHPPEGFDVAFWKAVDAAFDATLDLEGEERARFLSELRRREPKIAAEVDRLLERGEPQPSAGAAGDGAAAPSGTAATTPWSGPPTISDPRGFDALLQRALRAERSRSGNSRSPGEVCGAWRLDEIIGVGGMGEVWLASRADGLYQARAAVKFLRPDGDLERFEARFAQERALLARLNHPGIARLIDAGRRFGQPFLVLEYIDGKPLLNYISEHAPSVQARIELIREIGDAVAYAHSQLVVHRDLKPSNVLVTPGGHVKLLDFGVAGMLSEAERGGATASAATRLGGRGLTVEYAAPEQITGDATGVASDIYSLGALAYHVLAGHRAHLPEKQGRAALEHAVLHTTPPRVSQAATQTHPVTASDNIPPPSDPGRLVGDIDAIIGRAMRIEARDRYPSMEAFVADLRRWMAHRPIAARREERSYRTRLWLRRNWLPVGLTATLIFALAIGFGLSLWQYERARVEATRANKTADYLVAVLGRSDPDLHGGKNLSALELLDEAVNEARLRFGDDPITDERLTRLFATIYRSLARDGDALPLARRSLALSTAQHGADSLPTLRARSLLAWVLYWSDDYTEALATMQPVIEQLPRHLPAGSLELLETRQRYANILAGAYRLDESEAQFRAVIRDLQTTPEAIPDRAWKLADAEGDLAAAYTRAGRWQDALDLLRKNARQYANPPASERKTALVHRGNLITVQNVLGDPRGVERKVRELLAEWQRLAGERSERIDELLNDLGLYYMLAGDGEQARATFERLRSRLAFHPDADASEALRNQLDIIEIAARFNQTPPAELLAELETLGTRVAATVAPDSPRLRQLLLRAALVAAPLGRADLAEQLIATAQRLGRDSAPANVARLDVAQATVARIRSDFAAAAAHLDQRIKRFDVDRERVSLRRAYALIDRAYLAVLTGGGEAAGTAQSALSAARAAIPEGLPPNHRLFAQWNYVQAAAAHGLTGAETARLRGELAAQFHRRPDDLPAILSGFFVTP